MGKNLYKKPHTRIEAKFGLQAFGEESLADGQRIHSSQYEGLWTNDPKETFELPNHIFAEDTPSYVKRPVVHKYLKGKLTFATQKYKAQTTSKSTI